MAPEQRLFVNRNRQTVASPPRPSTFYPNPPALTSACPSLAAPLGLDHCPMHPHPHPLLRGEGRFYLQTQALLSPYSPPAQPSALSPASVLVEVFLAPSELQVS